jgi:hypothetical protein
MVAVWKAHLSESEESAPVGFLRKRLRCALVPPWGESHRAIRAAKV